MIYRFFRFIWSIICTAILGIVVLCGFYYASMANPDLLGNAYNSFATIANSGFNSCKYFLKDHGVNIPEFKLRKVTVAQLSDTTSEKKYTKARWASATATVYIATEDATLKSAYLSAISAWNNTGAFTFKIVTDKDKADIVCKTMTDANTQAAGETKVSIDAATKKLAHATVKLNKYYLSSSEYGYSTQRIINTAEHELGHAMGLKHTNQISVMQPSGSNYSIQQLDINNVKKLYAE